jgi:dihydroneopterin aldolase
MVFYGFHGVYPEERKLGQRFNVSLSIYTDDRLDSQIKELGDTVDYTKVYDEVKNIMERQQFQLLEDCANTIIENVFEKFELIKGLKVMIEKPGVPLNAALNCVAVEMERFR